MQGVKEKVTLWYSRGGWREVDMQFVMAMFDFDFVYLQSTKWPLPIDNAWRRMTRECYVNQQNKN